MSKLETIKTEVTRGSSYVHFKVKTDQVLTNAEIRELQIKAGYHPAGYDGPWNIRDERMPDGTTVYQWSCASSCD